MTQADPKDTPPRSRFKEPYKEPGRAGPESTPPRFYSEEVWARCIEHAKRERARRKLDCKVDWEEYRNEFELAARTYVSNVRSIQLLRISATRDRIHKLLDAVGQEFVTLSNWNLFNDAECLWINYEEGLGEENELIKALRTKVDDAVDKQRGFLGQGGHTLIRQNCQAEYKKVVLKIMRNLLDSREIGYADGPFIALTHMMLLPVLDNETPNRRALRRFTQRDKAQLCPIVPA
jgi:hypothetical protein